MRCIPQFGKVVLLLLMPIADSIADNSLLSRKKCKNKLPAVDVRLNGFSGMDNEIIVYESDKRAKYSIIAALDDKFIESNNRGKKTFVYRENPHRCHNISEFESEKLVFVTEQFIKALNDLEHNIHKDKWGKCLYLDAYFPKFLQSFYYLCYAISGAKNDILPRKAMIHDSLFDVSLKSRKTDRRILHWRDYDEHTVKMRIATQELSQQLRVWKHRFLDKNKVNRRAELMHRKKVADAYTLFIKLYFPKKRS